MSRKIVFVLGLSRVGSTMLDLVLGSRFLALVIEPLYLAWMALGRSTNELIGVGSFSDILCMLSVVPSSSSCFFSFKSFLIYCNGFSYPSDCSDMTVLRVCWVVVARY